MNIVTYDPFIVVSSFRGFRVVRTDAISFLPRLKPLLLTSLEFHEFLLVFAALSHFSLILLGMRRFLITPGILSYTLIC